MPLAVSNILWAEEKDETPCLRAARDAGADGIEVAPGRIAPWDSLDEAKAAAYRRKLEDLGFQIPSLQAIFFGCAGMALLGDPESYERLAEHLRRVAGIANRLGAKRLVFGAPKNRVRGAMDEKTAFDLAVERLLPVARDMKREGVALVFEAVPAAYGCDFIQTTREAARLVRAVGDAGLRLHLDIGAALAAGEDPAALALENADILAHLHVSLPGLGPLRPLGEAGENLDLALANVEYDGWASIEIKPQEKPLACLSSSIALARKTFSRTLRKICS